MPDRVRRIGEKQCGIVREVEGDLTLVWWGTRTNVEGRPGIEHLEWIPTNQLEPYPAPVVEPDAVIARQKAEREAQVRGR
jgi:hypothetical protein